MVLPRAAIKRYSRCDIPVLLIAFSILFRSASLAQNEIFLLRKRPFDLLSTVYFIFVYLVSLDLPLNQKGGSGGLPRQAVFERSTAFGGGSPNTLLAPDAERRVK